MPAGARRSGRAVLVTRPGDAGQRLTSALRERGQRALWWPAFDLLAPEDLEPLQALLRELARFDLAVFVSPAAVRGLAALDLCGAWPAGTAIAAAGASTLTLACNLLPGVAGARNAGLAAGARQSGSEALWEVLQQQSPLPRRVLIVRAESGREWLGERLREAGCRVEYASVYRRAVHAPGHSQLAALSACRSVGDRAASVLTSSEALAALDRQLERAPEARSWLRQGLALCSHPRVAQAAQAAGYAHVVDCEPSIQGVLDAIAGAARAEPGPARAQARAP